MIHNKNKPSHRMALAWNYLSQHFSYCSGQFCRSHKIQHNWGAGRLYPFSCPFWCRRGFSGYGPTRNTPGKQMTCRTPCQKLPWMQGPHGIKTKLDKTLEEIYWGLLSRQLENWWRLRQYKRNELHRCQSCSYLTPKSLLETVHWVRGTLVLNQFLCS